MGTGHQWGGLQERVGESHALSEGAATPDPGRPARIQDRFLHGCLRHPRALAIQGESSQWTYAELAQVSQALSLELSRRCQDGGFDCVALGARRTPTLVLAVLACLRAGLPFIILDASYPAARIQRMLQTLPRPLALGLDLSESEWAQLRGSPADAARAPVWHEAALRLLVPATFTGFRLPRPREPSETLAEPLAYYLQTSGTTGEPKCIQNTHAPLVHFIDWYAETFAVPAHTRFSMLSGLSHDPVLRDMLVPLSTGGVVCIPDQARLHAPNELFAWLNSERVAYLHATPQLLDLIAAGATGASLGTLACVFSGGDALRAKTVQALHKLAPQARLVNFYGTSETPQAMCFHEVDPARDRDPIPIGRGIEGVRMLVLDEAGAPVAPGQTGHIVVQTPYLALGYLNASAQDRARFGETQDAAARHYATGDRGQLRADGALVLCGRSDDQVKIRGFRVELAEVSLALRQLEGVGDALTLAAPLPSGEQRLCAFLLRQTGLAQPRDVWLQQQMRAQLPSYMVPARWFWLDRFPLMANNKIDRQQLLQLLVDENQPLTGGRSPQSEAERRLAQQWQQILGLPAFDTQLSFAEIGGDSLSFIEASVAVEEALGHLPAKWEEIPFFELFATEAPAPHSGAAVETVDLIRALAITLIVLSHNGLLFDLIDPLQQALGLHIAKSDLMWLPWSSYPLFVLAGYSFGRFQLPYLLRLGDGRPLLRTIAAIAWPTLLFTVVLQFKESLWHWPSLLLIDNFLPPPQATFASFWFIEVLVQCQLLLCLALCLPRVRQLLGAHRFAVPLLAMGASFALSLGMSGVWDTSALYDRVPHKLIWLLFMGWSLAAAQNRRQHLLVAGVSALSGLLYALNFESRFIVFSVASMLLIRYSPRIVLPRPVSALFTLVAKNTLFIYLVHTPLFAMIAFRLGPDHAYLQVGLAMGVGIAFGSVWRRLAQRLTAERLQARPPVQAEPSAQAGSFCALGPSSPQNSSPILPDRPRL